MSRVVIVLLRVVRNKLLSRLERSAADDDEDDNLLLMKLRATESVAEVENCNSNQVFGSEDKYLD